MAHAFLGTHILFVVSIQCGSVLNCHEAYGPRLRLSGKSVSQIEESCGRPHQSLVVQSYEIRSKTRHDHHQIARLLCSRHFQIKGQRWRGKIIFVTNHSHRIAHVFRAYGGLNECCQGFQPFSPRLCQHFRKHILVAPQIRLVEVFAQSGGILDGPLGGLLLVVEIEHKRSCAKQDQAQREDDESGANYAARGA